MSTGFLAVRQLAGDAASAIDAVVGASVREAREIEAFATRLGASREELPRLKFVAEQNNVAFGQLAIGTQRMTRRISS